MDATFEDLKFHLEVVFGAFEVCNVVGGLRDDSCLLKISF